MAAPADSTITTILHRHGLIPPKTTSRIAPSADSPTSEPDEPSFPTPATPTTESNSNATPAVHAEQLCVFVEFRGPVRRFGVSRRLRPIWSIRSDPKIGNGSLTQAQRVLNLTGHQNKPITPHTRGYTVATRERTFHTNCFRSNRELGDGRSGRCHV